MLLNTEDNNEFSRQDQTAADPVRGVAGMSAASKSGVDMGYHAMEREGLKPMEAM